ncbi:hypothetical protein CIPAW_09G151800 [Carya illinoinensis]|uniref:DUF4283 domain-containing protein n=1 Tax=Carya illinoinensis TaxID=32201 RepID=A0A8T1PN05_CARIL|nr:hypothetical protein CIPAW_09G151800 [Carya illinoinensis]
MRHPLNVFLHFASKLDIVKALQRENCDDNGIPYHAFHWTPDFLEDTKPSHVPVWISLPGQEN